MPVRLPEREISVPNVAALIELQRMRSLRWRISRVNSITQSGLAGSKDKSLKGIAISTVQPSYTDPGATGPDRVPFPDEIRVVLDELIEAPAQRVHDELIAHCAACSAGRDRRAPCRRRRNYRRGSCWSRGCESGVTVIGIDIDVKIVVVVEEAHIGAFGGGLPLVRVGLVDSVMASAFCQIGSERSPSTVGASAASIRVALAVGM